MQSVMVLWKSHANSKGKFVPFSVLRLQGFSKVLLTSGQLALVFQVLAKSKAVPSLSPPMVVKSSASMLLKLPQRPVD